LEASGTSKVTHAWFEPDVEKRAATFQKLV
jgi:hypothetical protein